MVEESKDDSEEFFEEETTYGNEMKAFERSGGYGSMLGQSIGPDGKPIKTQDPLEKFQIRVDAIARNLQSVFPGVISQDNIQTMLEKANQLKDVQYKNATAYVLGYIASTGGENLTPQTFKIVESKISKVHLEGNVKSPDILRYARLWQLQLK